MIKANELRIGNFFIYRINAENKICQIEGLNNEYVQLRVVNPLDFLEDEIPIDGCQPIPLTPEWLERCGFESNKEPDESLIYSIVKMDLDIASMEDGYYLRTNNTDPWHNTNVGRKMEYFHQLQNLYFALTGEELNVKL